MGLTRYIIIFLTASFLPSCGFRTKISAEFAGGPGPAVVSKVMPLAAKPGDIVKISGQNFLASKNLKARIVLTDGSTRDLPLSITDRNLASFVMPEGAGLGMRSVSVIDRKSTAVGSFNLIANQQDNKLPILIDEQSEICSTKEYIDINGDRKTGTKDCTTGSSSKPDCSADGVIGCLTTASFKSADMSLAIAGNIKSGVTIAGVSGTYIGVAPDPWDVRVGTTVNGVTGKLKVNCRNRVNSAIFNYDGPIGGIGLSAVNSGTAIDIWDTIDDMNNGSAGLPPSIVTAWGTNTDCGGVGTAVDDNVWTDVTTTAGGVASSCTATATRCTMKDKITGLWWSKLQSPSTWDVALSTCDSLDYNGYTDWRLPTQKELMEGYTHGIRSAASTNWMTEAGMFDNFNWSSTNISGDTAFLFVNYLAYGFGSGADRDSSTIGAVMCVRP